jgi:hypothetical protein
MNAINLKKGCLMIMLTAISLTINAQTDLSQSNLNSNKQEFNEQHLAPINPNDQGPVGNINIAKPENLSLKVFPNPASDYINVFLPDPEDENTSIGIFNIEGKRLCSSEYQSISGNVRIKVNNIHDGIYIIKIKKGNKTGTMKFIIKQQNLIQA